MPVIPINDLGSIGIVRDSPDHELAPEAWTSGSNVTFNDGGAHKTLGHSSIYGTPLGDPYWMLQSLKGASLYWVYSDLDAVYVTDGVTHKNISQAATTYNATADHGWNGGILNGVPFLNSGHDAPQYWGRDFPTPGLLADLTGWPPGGSTALAKVMRPFRNYIVGLDYTEDALRYEDMVIWSHGADPGTLPSSWDYTDPTVEAGRVQLSEKSGSAIDMLNIGGDLMVVYKNEGVWGMQYIGGGPVFRFWKMFDQVGVLSRRCVKEFKKLHFVLTLDADLIVHDTRTVQRIASKRVSRWLASQIDPTYYTRSFVAFNPVDKQVWACYPENNQTTCTAALTWNWEDGTFGHRQLPNVAHVGWGIVSEVIDDTWDADTEVWDSDTTLWDQLRYNPAQNDMLFGVPGTPQFYKAPSGSSFGGTAFTAYVERTGLALIGQDRKGRPIADPDRMKLLKSIRPRASATGAINVYGLSQMLKDGPVTYAGPYSFNPSTDFKVDLTLPGRLLGVKFEFPEGVDGSIYGYDLEIELMGRY